MNEVLPTVLIALGSSVATAFGQWVFFIRKHKAEADGAIKNNDRVEIENLKIITNEWREAAQAWKEMADEYHKKYLINNRKVDELVDEVANLKRQLNRAQKRIAHLEKETSPDYKSSKSQPDGNQ